MPCATVQKWLLLARFKVSQPIIDKLKKIVVPGQNGKNVTDDRIARIQKIDDAYSTVVNIDYFAVKVNKLPTINGRAYTAAEFMHYMRVNMNDFTTSGKVFVPYNENGVDDSALWKSNSPRGAILALDLDGPENGSVITSNTRTDNWTFTTIYEPKYGEHPVSGNREFGFVTHPDNTFTFYTRGVDRLTNWDATFFQNTMNIPFAAADNLWKGFQGKLESFIRLHGGESIIREPEIVRPKWSILQQVLAGKLPLSTLSKKCP